MATPNQPTKEDSLAKRAMIEQILARRKALSREPLAAQPRPEHIPMSFAQERLWYIEQIGLANGAYNISGGIRFEGTLDVQALSKALGAIVERHEALRTRFPVHDAQGIQVIDAPEPVPLAPTDIDECELVAQMTRIASQPFDLARDRLYRFTLFRLAPEVHALAIVMHHIVSDGWSIGVLVREMAALYNAFVSGKPSPLEPLPLQYADYALWQRRVVAADGLSHDLDFWRRSLAGAPAALELPTDRPRPPVQSSHGARIGVTVPASLVATLTGLARSENATLFMVLLSALQIVLSRWSGQSDIVVGSTIAGRDQAKVEPLIGFFINTVALRTDLSGNPTFRQVLVQVRNTTLDAYGHQAAPFDRVIAEVQPQRDASRHPIFQVLFVLQNLPERNLALDGLRVRSLGDGKATAKMDLSLNLRQVDGALRGTLEYATDLFDETTVRRLIGHWQNLLAQVAQDAERAIADLPMLTDAEREAILGPWSGAEAAYDGSPALLHQRFEAHAKRAPDALAVIAGEHRLSYHELDLRANGIAQRLRAAGVGPEVVVGLRIARSAELLIGLLGILKAGGVYLPLDPALPSQRVHDMLSDARATHLVTTASLAQDGIGKGLVAVAVDGGEPVEDAWCDAPAVRTEPDHLAYVIFTSGSTGRPKGVMATHRGAVNYLNFLCAHYALEREDRVLNVSGIGFDPSLRDLLGPLSSGGACVLVAGTEVLDAHRYWTTLCAHRVTRLLSITPSFLTLLCRVAQAQPAAHVLRDILTCGEPLDAKVVARVKEALGAAVRVVNQYGPTECTMSSTWHVADGTQTGIVPIGRPLPNAQLFVLDSSMQPVPVGVTGELYIGGAGVTRGYLGRPDLSAERFVPHPFGHGARLYRTGDHVRWNTQGELEYIGRTDFQVKLRGVRVELNEIVSALNALPGIDQSAVLVHGDGDDQKLVAYLVAGQQALSPERIAQALKVRLPDAMIPNAFVPIDAIPLTPNGKLDRAALPAPGTNMLRGRFAAPESGTEQAVAEIFAVLLKLERVGRDDNFFMLGGHSLLATRVMAHIGERFGVKPTLRMLFERPTVAALAEHIDSLQSDVSVAPEEDLLASIERLSDDAAARLLNELAN